MSEIEALASAIRLHAPGARINTEPDTLHNNPVDGVLPRLLVVPSSVEQVAQIVALTHQHGLTLLVRGGGSRLNVGGLPQQLDVLLDTQSLTRLLEYEAPDLTCHVEAGLTLASLQAHLATRGQRLALDPPDAEQATLGGIVASNASGPKRLRYGTARDLVIGLRTVQADGEIARSGGRVVKNVAGYDLNKLYVGSFGTLGVIVELNFKLHPLPVTERTLLLTFKSALAAMRTVIALQNSTLTPAAIELIDAGAAADLSDFSAIDVAANGYTLAVNFEGDNTTIARQLREARLLARSHNALPGAELSGEAQNHFWNAVRGHTRGTVTCKAALLVARVADYLQTIEQICRKHRLEAAIVAHAGNGILYIELRPGDATSRLMEAINELRRRAQEARGSLIVECCPVELKRRINVWGEPGGDFYLMQRLKQRFDPKGTFARGRFVGEL